MLLHETADLRIKCVVVKKIRLAVVEIQKIETANGSLTKPPQSPAGPCRRAGYKFLAHGQFRAYCASSEASGGTLPHTALPTPEAKECSCEVDPRRSTSSKPSDWRYAAISSTRKWLRYKTRHREERFFCCPQSRSFWQRA